MTPMDEQNFEVFARKICEFAMQNYFLPFVREHGMVMSYRAQVVSIDHDAGTMVVQRPFDQQITIPYADSANGLQAGDQCVVFCLGDAINSVIVSDGKLNL